MKATETKFETLAEGTKQYVIPLFQRAYSWTKREWEVLWEDLVWLCENEEPKTHFIGSIVTIPSTSVPEGIAKFLLIDGQQRITTLFVLLAVVRDLTQNHTEMQQISKEIEQLLLTNQFKKGDDFFKLLPTQVDRQSFKSIIKNEELSSNSSLSDCYHFFVRKAKNVNFEILFTVIKTRLSIVSIVLDSDDNPHLVFESLNAKGRSLTQSDLIRNYFFMRIHVDKQTELYDQYWRPMQIALADSLPEFIRHYLMRSGTNVKQGDVYFTLKDRVGQANAIEELGNLAKFSVYYEKFLNPNNDLDNDLRSSLFRLKRLEVTTCYPFLLNCFDDFYEDRISKNDLVNIIALIENYITHVTQPNE